MVQTKIKALTKTKTMKELKLIRIDLQRSIVYDVGTSENCIGGILAIYDAHKAIVVVHDGAWTRNKEIAEFISKKFALKNSPVVTSGNGFSIDTWDNTIANYKLKK